jgi:hypothetical protein
MTSPPPTRHRTRYGAERRGDVGTPPVDRRGDPYARWDRLVFYALSGVLCLIFWALVLVGILYLLA